MLSIPSVVSDAEENAHAEDDVQIKNEDMDGSRAYRSLEVVALYLIKSTRRVFRDERLFHSMNVLDCID